MLTPEQQKIIENSLWVVNTALQRQGLSRNNDLRQSAIEYMCKCLRRYNADKMTKWTTYAYKNVYFFIKRTRKHQRSINYYERNCIEIDLFEKESEDYAREFVMQLKAQCTDLENTILDLKLKGYSSIEIGRLLNLTEVKVGKIFKAIKEKAMIIRQNLV